MALFPRSLKIPSPNARDSFSCRRMRALLAFDKFKDALSAQEACRIAAEALRENHPDWLMETCPLTDGGEGFAEILTQACRGKIQTARVTGPRGDAVEANYGVVSLARIPPAARALLALPTATPLDASIAIVEMASASGLALLPAGRRDPWQTHTTGTGELIRIASECGAAAILLGVGGSATNDLGLGALAALGLEFRGTDDSLIAPPTPAQWPRIARLSGGVSTTLPPIRIACDVANPLLGSRGCAAVYGPQKGLRGEDLARLEHASARLALMLTAHCGQPDAMMDTPGAGAAGGIAFGLMTAARATLLPGFSLVTSWLDLDRRIAESDLVITGEGRFDESSLEGKGPGAIVDRARALGREVHVFAGTIGVSRDSQSLHAITPASLPLAEALPATSELLRSAIRSQFC